MSSLPPAVLAYEVGFSALLFYSKLCFHLMQRFLKQTGGHCGGWDQYDHQMFLKIRTNNFQVSSAHKSIQKLMINFA